MATQTYVERPPLPGLADLVRVVWIQRVGPEPYVQRNLPTGGVELHCPIGSTPRLVGPLTGPSVDVLPPWTTVVGLRFHPGVAAAVLGLPASELVDLTVPLDAIWGRFAVVIGELVAAARSPEMALFALQDRLIRGRDDATAPDPLMSEAVRRLMPWRSGQIAYASGEIAAISAALAISESQLRRRCLASVGIGPKALQRTLRFQGFLALVQSRAAFAGSTGLAGLTGRAGLTGLTGPAEQAGRAGLAGLAAEAGYADHAHLSRECLRLTSLPPRAFLGDVTQRCGCGHHHSASFIPMLRGRFRRAAVPA